MNRQISAPAAAPAPVRRGRLTQFMRFPVRARYASTRPPRRRIAQKLFLFYVLPLSVLILAGLLLPIFLWSYFGQIISGYGESRQFEQRVGVLRQLGRESESLYGNYVVTGNAQVLRQATETARQLRFAAGDCEEYADSVAEPSLRNALSNARRSYNQWYLDRARPAARAARIGGVRAPQFNANLVRAGYVGVQSRMDSLVARATEHMNERLDQARVADAMRRVTIVVVPTLALVLSVLIGRSIALGITRPLESLTHATEELEQGGGASLLAEMEAATPMQGDELGDLQSAFGRMARTIRQRETVLRAQNEALGSLNQRVESVLNATNDGILMLDRAGAFSVVNQQFALLFGIEADILLDQTFTQASPLILARFKNRAAVRAALERLLDDPEASADEIVEVVEPVARTLRLYSAPVRGETREGEPPELLGRIFVFRDVTREMIVDRMKTEFVSTVSHELRTPLTAIKGYVDMMVEGKTGPLNATQTEFLEMMQSSTDRLNALIGDLLDISRIESGRMELKRESVDYLNVLHQSVRVMQNEADARRIRLTVEVTPVAGDTENFYPKVLGDADRITQVLVNLISNGIKYTPPGGDVTLRVEFDPEEQVVATCVADTGIGIHADDLPRLFTKFFRADNSTTRETGGTGLGLAITKATLEKLRGVIWVESQPDEGSRFWFTLPLVSAASEAGLVAGPLARGGTGKDVSGAAVAPLVLSIDGDRAALHRLGHSLRHQGWVTSTAATPSEALRRARGLRPDLITLDPLSPGFDGFALLARLRGDTATAHIPVVLLSLRQAGADAVARNTFAYLPRGLGRDTLTSTIRQMLVQFPRTGSEATVVLAGVVPDAVQEDLRQFVAEAVTDIRPGDTSMTLLLSAHFAEVEAALGTQTPSLLILDTTCAPQDGFGDWICHLRDQQAVPVRLPILVITEPALAPYLNCTLPMRGQSAMPLPAVGTELRTYLSGASDNPEDHCSAAAQTTAPAV